METTKDQIMEHIQKHKRLYAILAWIGIFALLYLMFVYSYLVPSNIINSIFLIIFIFSLSVFIKRESKDVPHPKSLYLIFGWLLILSLLMTPTALHYRYSYGGISDLLTSPIVLWTVSILWLLLWLKWRISLLISSLLIFWSFGAVCKTNPMFCVTDNIYDHYVLSHFFQKIIFILLVSYSLGRIHWALYNWFIGRTQGKLYNWLKWLLSILIYIIIIYVWLGYFMHGIFSY